MTNLQESHLNMHMNVRDFLNLNASIVGTLPNYPALFTTYQNSISQLQQLASQQEFDKTGIAKSKNLLKDTLVIQAIDVARKVAAYATFVSNAILLEEVNYCESDLRKSTDTGLRDKAQAIYDRANANVGALATYGVTPQNLTTLLGSITAYNAIIPKTRQGVIEKKRATEQIALLFEALSNSLEKIDILIETLRISQPNFYAGYMDAHKVVDTGIGSLALRALALEAGTEEPIKGATFTFIHDVSLIKAVANGNGNGNGHPEIVKKTAEKGRFHIKSMPEGTYQVTVSKPGYKDKMVTVSVADGEMTELEVELEKI